MANSDILSKLRTQLATLRRAAKSQRDIGNIEEAQGLDASAEAAEKIYFDVAAMLLQNPNTSEAEVLTYVQSLYK